MSRFADWFHRHLIEILIVIAVVGIGLALWDQV